MPEFQKKAMEYNRKVRQAERDGYYTCGGYVFERKPEPWENAAPLIICKVEEYGRNHV